MSSLKTSQSPIGNRSLKMRITLLLWLTAYPLLGVNAMRMEKKQIIDVNENSSPGTENKAEVHHDEKSEVRHGKKKKQKKISPAEEHLAEAEIHMMDALDHVKNIENAGMERIRDTNNPTDTVFKIQTRQSPTPGDNHNKDAGSQISESSEEKTKNKITERDATESVGKSGATESGPDNDSKQQNMENLKGTKAEPTDCACSNTEHGGAACKDERGCVHVVNRSTSKHKESLEDALSSGKTPQNVGDKEFEESVEDALQDEHGKAVSVQMEQSIQQGMNMEQGLNMEQKDIISDSRLKSEGYRKDTIKTYENMSDRRTILEHGVNNINKVRKAQAGVLQLHPKGWSFNWKRAKQELNEDGVLICILLALYFVLATYLIWAQVHYCCPGFIVCKTMTDCICGEKKTDSSYPTTCLIGFATYAILIVALCALWECMVIMPIKWFGYAHSLSREIKNAIGNIMNPSTVGSGSLLGQVGGVVDSMRHLAAFGSVSSGLHTMNMRSTSAHHFQKGQATGSQTGASLAGGDPTAKYIPPTPSASDPISFAQTVVLREQASFIHGGTTSVGSSVTSSVGSETSPSLISLVSGNVESISVNDIV